MEVAPIVLRPPPALLLVRGQVLADVDIAHAPSVGLARPALLVYLEAGP